MTVSPSSPEEVLRNIFSALGTVQTCIVNVDKRHAFVKMITRRDAMAAKEGMERFKSAEMQLRVFTCLSQILAWCTDQVRPDGA